MVAFQNLALSPEIPVCVCSIPNSDTESLSCSPPKQNRDKNLGLINLGFPDGASGKEHTCQCRRHRFDSWVEYPLEEETATHSSILA